jgi:hypothetical protein
VAALARPISPTTLCGSGLAKRAGAVSSNTFVAVDTSLGINHWHSVADAVWQQAPGSLQGVMRTAAVVATDVDADCWPDLVFTSGATTNGQLVVYENSFGTRFSQGLLHVTPATNPVAGLGAADLNGDYRTDLVTGNLLAGNTEIYRANAADGFTLLQSIPMPRSTVGFAFGDYSGDAWLDMHAAHWERVPPAAAAPALLRNLGPTSTAPGMLSAADAAAGTTPASVPQDFNASAGFADLDGDRNPDLLVASDFGTSRLLRHTGAAAYAVLPGAVLSDENASGQAIRDFDNDERWDWFVASVHGPGDGRPWPWGVAGNKLYFGSDQSPYLTAPGPAAGIEDAGWPWGVCAEDFNNDSLVDLFVENGFGFAPAAVMAAQAGTSFVQQIDQSLFDMKFQRARLFVNQGNRSFVDESQAWGLNALTNGRGVACLDYDRDGDVDIAVAQNSGPALFYENRHAAADGGNFIAVRLIAAAPNTRAVGAIVRIEAGGQSQMRQVSANGSFQGQDGGAQHFGLAGATTVDSLVVTWPDGSTRDYGMTTANRFLTLLDPDMLPYRDAALLSRIDAAIDAALAYVSGPDTRSYDMLALLTWVVRMHGVSLPYSPSDRLLALTPPAGTIGYEGVQLRSIRRIYDPLYQLSSADYGQLISLDAMTYAAVNCHQFPLDDADMLTWADYSAQGGYETTHALLALIWAIDNGCAMPTSYDSDLLDVTVGRVYNIAAANVGAMTDLRIEAMAFLAAAGRHDLIQASWVVQLLDAQQGGGWKTAPDAVALHDHPTALALWLLLQLAEQGKVLPGYIAQTWDP